MSPSTPASRSEASKKAAATRAARAAAAQASGAPEIPAGPGAPGPKPPTLVVGETLKCQSIDGEISLSLLVPYAKFKLVMNMDDIPEAEIVDFLLDEVMDPADKDKLVNLRDGAETLKFAMAWMEAIGERLGSSVGKSGPSSS